MIMGTFLCGIDFIISHMKKEFFFNQTNRNVRYYISVNVLILTLTDYMIGGSLLYICDTFLDLFTCANIIAHIQIYPPNGNHSFIHSICNNVSICYKSTIWKYALLLIPDSKSIGFVNNMDYHLKFLQ